MFTKYIITFKNDSYHYYRDLVANVFRFFFYFGIKLFLNSGIKQLCKWETLGVLDENYQVPLTLLY